MPLYSQTAPYSPAWSVRSDAVSQGALAGFAAGASEWDVRVVDKRGPTKLRVFIYTQCNERQVMARPNTAFQRPCGCLPRMRVPYVSKAYGVLIGACLFGLG